MTDNKKETFSKLEEKINELQLNPEQKDAVLNALHDNKNFPRSELSNLTEEARRDLAEAYGVARDSNERSDNQKFDKSAANKSFAERVSSGDLARPQATELGR